MTIVILESRGSMVGAVHKLSMLKPLPLNNPDTLERTPGWLSTSIVMVCFFSSIIEFLVTSYGLRVAGYA